ncbi:hypothetical protein BCR33DRAFT_772169 [Rhizoclosmatium globosum]|uniref:L domain-like protein n=1 Tax=Rhizoclosmatium globosum TaxID=329046 RepID=A0A1Y2B8R0_9FUNG|nr:hypothetical protein BCR33DRAFT_772169 [Rhizoclosmatium globosum]|eukprot:ORY30485.1 hypothetical protein BCR33DRAFT_772169 [Rhizoclosmatium globosum]
MQRQTSNSPRTGKRGDRQTKAVATNAAKASAHADLLAQQDSKTVRQRVAEARRSAFLDLSSLNLSLLPEDVWDLDNLRALLLYVSCFSHFPTKSTHPHSLPFKTSGNNNFTAVPPNLANAFPQLQYLDMSQNQISHLPSNLSDMQDILVLDFSDNEGLAGSALPPAYGPIRHRVAVFVDDESIEFLEPGTVRHARRATDEVTDEEEDNNNDDERNQDGGDDQYGETDESDTYHEEDDDEEEEDSFEESGDDDRFHERTIHKRHDLMEDVALKLRKFMRMVKDLEDATDLEGQFRRLLAEKDPIFVKYLSKRYHSEDGILSDDGDASDGAEYFARRKERKELDFYERKEKEKYVKGSRAVGRKMKASMLSE